MRFRLLDELLQTSDIVTLHVPLTDETRHMINAETLALMKPHARISSTPAAARWWTSRRCITR